VRHAKQREGVEGFGLETLQEKGGLEDLDADGRIKLT
jgi:hypothetical protein